MKKIMTAMALLYLPIISACTHFNDSSEGHHGQCNAAYDHGCLPAYKHTVLNPIISSSQSIRRGESAYKEFCSECHGATAKGDGPRSQAMGIKPSDLSKLMKDRSDYEIFLQMSLGSMAMPQQRISLQEEDRWDIVNYLRSLAR